MNVLFVEKVLCKTSLRKNILGGFLGGVTSPLGNRTVEVQP